GLNMLMRLGQSIYGAHQQNVLAGNLNNQLNSLQSIFSPTGAYAQQLQKQLMAQDAARGLRSQYGTRAVELQAALAKAEAQMLGGQGYTNLNTAAANASSGGLNSLFANAGNILGMTGTPATGNTKSNVPNIMLQL
ncbi:MAG: hypothetical protein KGI54_16900, partial [Pseudomonadota bacterium]|nr:hypothetical protein [Pseudomonadota bacterium]